MKRGSPTRSAELHSAVSQICNLQGVAATQGTWIFPRASTIQSPIPFARPAECNSAIRQITNLRYGVRLFLPLLCLLALCQTCFGMAQEQSGPDSPDRPTVSQPGWNKGIVELPRHESRVYSIWVNGNETFYFQASPDGLNELIDLFSKAHLRDHELWINSDTNPLKTFNGASHDYNAFLNINGGIARAFNSKKDSGDTLEPRLTISVGHDPSLLKKLRFPGNLVVHCDVEGAGLTNKTTIPVRKTWHGRVQTSATNPADTKASGLVTQITLWDESSPDGIPINNAFADGSFTVAFSDEEFDKLTRGNLWLTITTGNFLTTPKKDDQRFPAGMLSLDKASAKPVPVGAPAFHHGRILFEDGTPAVLNPAPWPGAEIFADFSYVGSCQLDAEGYFKLVLNPDQIAALKSRKPSKNIYVPVEKRGCSTALYEFPPGLLSLEKSNAGVVRIPRPVFTPRYDLSLAPSLIGITPQETLDAARVLAIARSTVATNDTWLDKAEFETPRRRADGTWSVMVWRLPKTPGGHRLINIDTNGKVTDYMRGR